MKLPRKNIDLYKKPRLPLKVVNCSKINNDKWLDYRRQGIGGSDAASLVGLSKWRTALELYYDKLGETPKENISPQKQYIFDFGHAMEAFVAEHYEKVFMDEYKDSVELNFSAHYGQDISISSCKVYRDTWMYQHPVYFFMRADLDFKIDLKLSNGKKVTGIFECKTTSPFRITEEWKDGPPKYYEVQTRHYMAVMDYPFAIIACAADNNANNYYSHVIFRDYEYEKTLIEQEGRFWEAVQSKNPPYEMGVDNLLVILSTLNNQQCDEVIEDSSPFVLSKLSDLERIKVEISSRKREVAALEKRKNIISSDLLTYMVKDDKMAISANKDNSTFVVSVDEKCSEAVNWAKFIKNLKSTHPELSQEIDLERQACLKNPIPVKSLSVDKTIQQNQKSA